MLNLFNVLAYSGPADFCTDPAVNNIMYLIGVVVGVIKIAVPVILIIVGMVDLIKAITSQDEKQIKPATTFLVKKVVIGIIIFLVPTIVRLLMNIIAQSDYEDCINCVTSVWGSGCSWSNN